MFRLYKNILLIPARRTNYSTTSAKVTEVQQLRTTMLLSMNDIWFARWCPVHAKRDVCVVFRLHFFHFGPRKVANIILPSKIRFGWINKCKKLKQCTEVTISINAKVKLCFCKLHD